MAKIQWQSAFGIGIKEIDDEHREFIELIGKLEEFSYSTTAEAHAQEVLRELAQKALPHFAREEQLMAEGQFAGIDHHAALHQEFLVHLGSILKKLKRDGTINPHEFLSYLKSWLINHVMREDSKLRRFVSDETTGR